MRNWLEQSPITVGVGLVVLGFVFIFLAWNGAAGQDAIEAQFPYVISGGIAGLGLIAAGLSVIVIQARRTDTQQLSARIDELAESIRAFTGEEAPRSPATAAEADSTRPKGRPRKAKRTRRTRSRQPR